MVEKTKINDKTKIINEPEVIDETEFIDETEVIDETLNGEKLTILDLLENSHFRLKIFYLIISSFLTLHLSVLSLLTLQQRLCVYTKYISYAMILVISLWNFFFSFIGCAFLSLSFLYISLGNSLMISLILVINKLKDLNLEGKTNIKTMNEIGMFLLFVFLMTHMILIILSHKNNMIPHESSLTEYYIFKGIKSNKFQIIIAFIIFDIEVHVLMFLKNIIENVRTQILQGVIISTLHSIIFVHLIFLYIYYFVSYSITNKILAFNCIAPLSIDVLSYAFRLLYLIKETLYMKREGTLYLKKFYFIGYFLLSLSIATHLLLIFLRAFAENDLSSDEEIDVKEYEDNTSEENQEDLQKENEN